MEYVKTPPDALSLELSGWADTRNYFLGAVYLKCPAGTGPDTVQTGEFKTRTYPVSLPEVTSARIRLSDFTSPPKVIVWLKRLEMSHKENWCINVTASDVSARGFQLNINTWGRSRVFAADVTWMAYPADSTKILSGVVGGGMPGSVRQEKSYEGVISFPELETKPKVLLGLSGFDIKCDLNLSIQTKVWNVSSTGMNWSIGKRADAKVGGVAAQYIAFLS